MHKLLSCSILLGRGRPLVSAAREATVPVVFWGVLLWVVDGGTRPFAAMLFVAMIVLAVYLLFCNVCRRCRGHVASPRQLR